MIVGREFGPIGGQADGGAALVQIDPVPGHDGRHPGAGEGEMVGPVVVVLLRLAVIGDHPALGGGQNLQPVLQIILALAEDRQVAGRGRQGQHVDIDVGDRGLQRPDRVGCIAIGSQQTHLLGRHMGEDDRAFRPRGGAQLTRHLDHADGARGIVPGAVPDVVARHARMLGRAADMVPVGRIDDGFVRTLGPRNPGQQIVGDQGVDGLGRLDRQGHTPQLDRLEATVADIGQPGEIQPGGGGPDGGDVMVDAARNLQIGGPRRQGAGPAAAAHRALPHGRGGVAGHQGQDADRAASEGLVGLGRSRGIGGLIGPVEARILRLARHDNHDLAAHIGGAIVVPLTLGRMDTMADEDQAGVADAGPAVIGRGPQDDVGSGRQGVDDAVRACPAGRRTRNRRIAFQLDRLQPLAVRPARLQPHGLILGLQPGQGHLLALGARIAALVFVGADGADALTQLRGGKVLGRGHARGQQNGSDGDAAHHLAKHTEGSNPGLMARTLRGRPHRAH